MYKPSSSLLLSIAAIFLVSMARQLCAEDALTVSHYQAHNRYDYGAKLLEIALSKLDRPYQINVVTSDNIMLNEARGELEVINGNIDLQWMTTSPYREQEMIPIRIPLYQGILGMRLLLVNQKHQNKMSQIQSLSNLQQYTGGHGLHWGDLPVYAANNLPVMPHKDYDSIFKLLELERIDYFHRGINEIWGELTKYQSTLAIADNIMIYYPNPVYFFVSKKKPQLADLIETGLYKALNDGSYKALFDQKMAKFVEQAQLEQRNLVVLQNPALPLDSPYIETDWWLPQKFQEQLQMETNQHR